MNYGKRLADNILECFNQEEAENDLTNYLVRNDEVFGLIVAIEGKLEKKETLIERNDTEQMKCKLLQLVIKKFDGNVLN